MLIGPPQPASFIMTICPGTGNPPPRHIRRSPRRDGPLDIVIVPRVHVGRSATCRRPGTCDSSAPAQDGGARMGAEGSSSPQAPLPATPLPADEGFDAFYAAQFRRVSAQIHAYLGDLAEAQDVVQEAFTRAWPRWERIRRYEDPAAWVRRVAWNLATSRWRRLRTAASF